MSDNEPCIGCGFCCIDSPCGLSTEEPCPHLNWNGTRYLCDQFPFDKALSRKDSLYRIIALACLRPNRGCNSYDKYQHLAEARLRHASEKGAPIC